MAVESQLLHLTQVAYVRLWNSDVSGVRRSYPYRQGVYGGSTRRAKERGAFSGGEPVES